MIMSEKVRDAKVSKTKREWVLQNGCSKMDASLILSPQIITIKA